MNGFFVKFCALALVFAAALLTLAPAGLAQKTDKNWKGSYFGFNLGEALGTSDVATTTIAPAGGYFAPSSVTDIAPVGAQHLAPRAFSAGGQAGYNLQLGHLVVGAEADFGKLSFNKSVSATAPYTCPGCTLLNYSFRINQSVKTGGLLTVRPRIGYASGGLLVYATAGLAATHLNYQASFADNYLLVSSIYATENGGIAKTASGLVAGGGIEHRMGDRLSVKAEYLYAKFGSVSATSTNLATPVIRPTVPATTLPWPTNVFTHTATLHANIARIGFNYRF
ncbi:MAG: outer membrane beta-barrel protein [Acidobacteriia bacterium]|nr:outer membrane beta-barrel protein [Terriglobia bacterium]